MTNYTITANTAFNSLEITFDGKPSEAVRTALKDLKFRWHSLKKGWYGYTTEETARKAIETAEGGSTTETPKATKEAASKAEKVNKYGVKVGSIGRWGMDRVDDNGEIIPEALQHDKNCIDLASKLGCPVFNCGCNEVESKSFMENCDIAINYLSKLIESTSE